MQLADNLRKRIAVYVIGTGLIQSVMLSGLFVAFSLGVLPSDEVVPPLLLVGLMMSCIPVGLWLRYASQAALTWPVRTLYSAFFFLSPVIAGALLYAFSPSRAERG